MNQDFRSLLQDRNSKIVPLLDKSGKYETESAKTASGGKKVSKKKMKIETDEYYTYILTVNS